jgi:hypothetical protein
MVNNGSPSIVSTVIQYGFGILMVLLAFGAVESGLWRPALLFVLTALLLIPPVWARLMGGRPDRVPGAIRWVCVIVLSFVAVLATGVDGTRQEERAQQAGAQARQAEYDAVRDSLHSIVSTAMAEGNYGAAIQTAGPWADVMDDSLAALHEAAKSAQATERAAAREAALLEEVRGLPGSDTDGNLRIYTELATLAPDNERYAASVERYKAAKDREAAEERERAEAEARRATLVAKWSYRTDTDDMTGRTARYATIRSENTVNFSFPYQGAQRATLAIRTHPSYGRDVLFQIEKGQILCTSYTRCRVRVRFGDGQPQTWGANEAADGSSTTIFLQDYDTFVARMRRSGVVRIQPEIFQEGAPVFEFQAGGFDFDRHRGR